MNPSAFPHKQFNETMESEAGMTLRDYFAAKALNLTDRVGRDTIGTQSVNLCQSPEEKAQRIAKRAYLIADAMLAERAKDSK